LLLRVKYGVDNGYYMKKRFLIIMLLACLLGLSGRARADDLPDSASVSGVVGHPQTYMLSCESRAASDWAAFLGVEFTETEFLNQLPRSDNPDRGFVGDPNDAWGGLPPNGYGVHADPVADLLQDYGLDADARAGLSWDDLRVEIAAERPVIVWVIGQMWAGYPVEYSASDGSTVTVAPFEHSMILVGYTPETVQVVDPTTGWPWTYALSTFLASWGVLGNMAVVLEVEAVPQAPAEPTPLPLPVINAPWVLRLPLVYRSPQVTLQPAADAPSLPDLPETYTVKVGDNLILLGQGFGLDWRGLAALNNLDYPFVIFPGQVLSLP